VGVQVVDALLVLPQMPWKVALASVAFRVADITPLLSATAMLVWLFRQPPAWILPWMLHGLAVCVACAGLLVAGLYADVPSGLAWLRSALLCAAAVEGIQWSLVREAKAVARA
jgi:xanthine/uracil/vitamin C permease (AzgA family)